MTRFGRYGGCPQLEGVPEAVAGFSRARDARGGLGKRLAPRGRQPGRRAVEDVHRPRLADVANVLKGDADGQVGSHSAPRKLRIQRIFSDGILASKRP
jgi:hypothetical protein